MNLKDIPSENQWRIDLKNTRIEVTAYHQIASGFEKLSNLPENAKSRSVYFSKFTNFKRSAFSCEQFLNSLIKFGKAHGYTEEKIGQ